MKKCKECKGLGFIVLTTFYGGLRRCSKCKGTGKETNDK
jgi:DnaJ-class molecular chaperone